MLRWGFIFSMKSSKKLKLFWRRCQWGALYAPKVMDIGILSVSHLNYANMPTVRNKTFNSFHMNQGTLETSTMSGVNAVLHHGKTIALQFFSKLLGSPLLFFTGGRQIKKYEKPHDMIFI
jgi:hypothetical protein